MKQIETEYSFYRFWHPQRMVHFIMLHFDFVKQSYFSFLPIMHKIPKYLGSDKVKFWKLASKDFEEYSSSDFLGKPFSSWGFYWDTDYANIPMMPEFTDYSFGVLFELLKKEGGWEDKESFGHDNYDRFMDYFIDTDIVTPAATISKPCYCRSCNEFHPYAEPDGIVDDEKFTCWRCANSPERIKIGLDSNFELMLKQKDQIIKLNNVRF